MDILPFDIWDNITGFLTEGELASLIGVNAFFFSLGMAARYNDITIDTGDKKGRKWMLRLLEPKAAERVRKLTVHLVHPQIDPARASQSGPSVRKQIIGQLRIAIDKVIPGRPESHSSQPRSGPRIWDESVVETLVDAMSRMANVVDFRIVTWALQSNYNVQSLYSAAWAAFGGNLKRVSICANLGGHRSLIESNPFLENLETLELEFSDNVTTPQVSDSVADAAIMVETIVPFVNKLCPQIRTFKIRSWAKLDLSPFFLHLNPLPQLETTLIRIPFNHALRSDPSGFTNFLHESSGSLKDIALRLSPLGVALDPLREEPLCEWMTNTVSEPRCFSKATELDICPTHLPGGIDILLSCIQHSIAQLTTFKVRDRYLSGNDVASIVKELRPSLSLTTLRLNVFTLTGAMFDLMASSLPGLRLLWLSVGDRDPTATDSLEIFRCEMEGRVYEDWKLWDLTIWQAGIEPDRKTMLALARSIPSVRSFWGTGHTNVGH